VVLTGPDGNPIVIVQPPSGNNVTVTPGSAPPPPGGTVSPVVNVSGDSGGATITILTNITDPNSHHLCLGYFDETLQQWKCVDECVSIDATPNGTYVTGTTPHFTNFAILLEGGGCSSEPLRIATYVALGVAATTAVIFVLMVIWIRPVSVIVLGDEAVRVRTLRRITRKLESDAVADEPGPDPFEQPVPDPLAPEREEV
jgi:hypothetical protein